MIASCLININVVLAKHKSLNLLSFDIMIRQQQQWHLYIIMEQTDVKMIDEQMSMITAKVPPEAGLDKCTDTAIMVAIDEVIITKF